MLSRRMQPIVRRKVSRSVLMLDFTAVLPAGPGNVAEPAFAVEIAVLRLAESSKFVDLCIREFKGGAFSVSDGVGKFDEMLFCHIGI